MASLRIKHGNEDNAVNRIDDSLASAYLAVWKHVYLMDHVSQGAPWCIPTISCIIENKTL